MTQSTGNPKGRKQTLIEDETQFQGVLRSECAIVVKGTVDGEVSGPSLQVSESGAVSGTVKVDSLESQGTLSGEFEASSVQLAGTVKDKTVIRARSLEVKLKSQSRGLEVMFGDCDLEIGDVPSKEEAVSEALASARASEEQAPRESEPADKEGESGKKRRESTSPAST